ncbi:MAG TPA: undecaprenyl-diphosphate phosphatase [Gemmatimonadales bacterium]|jgi:undecaprenyl-diphosphatase
MILPALVVAAILGLVEGITEFLPVSSTGHLIVAGSLLSFTGERAATFEIVIQVGAIFAVIWHYRALLGELLMRWFQSPAERRLGGSIVVAFLPAALVGLGMHRWIKLHLFTPVTVAGAFIVGGIVILILEWRRPAVSTDQVHGISTKQALGIGCAQVLALFPGTSRSAATILGGYALGLSRAAATEFSFLLAIPTLIAAAGYDIFKSRHLFTAADIPMFAVGIGVSFVAALFVIRGFLRYVQRHSFTVFAWYRIAFGVLILGLAALHLLRMDAT